MMGSKRTSFPGVLLIVLGLAMTSPPADGEVIAGAVREAWEAERAVSQRAWEEAVLAESARWEVLKRDVEEKWGEFIRSTRKEWVAYSVDLEARSQVDFEKGRINIEAIVPEADPNGRSKAREMVREQAQRIFTQESAPGHKLLGGQVKNSRDQAIDSRNLNDYFDEELGVEIAPEPVPFRSRDGIVRRKYEMSIKMVPEHLEIRARALLPAVERSCSRFRLEVPLVLSIIHTESWFNPMAISSCGAIGLMQIMPRHAGREVYLFLYGRDQVPSSRYLHDPDNNIELGTGYLHLLKYQYFSDVPSAQANAYVTICAYNWGPTAVRQKILSNYRVQGLSDQAVLESLLNRTPRQTSEYLRKVVTRMPAYENWLVTKDEGRVESSRNVAGGAARPLATAVVPHR